jgi:hypothetical protein
MVLLLAAAVLVIVAARAAVTAHQVLLFAGLLAALYAGQRFGSWWALTRLGEYERKQRVWRVRNWWRKTGG